MQIPLNTDNPRRDALREEVRGVLVSALGRFAGRVTRVGWPRRRLRKRRALAVTRPCTGASARLVHWFNAAAAEVVRAVLGTRPRARSAGAANAACQACNPTCICHCPSCSHTAQADSATAASLSPVISRISCASARRAASVHTGVTACVSRSAMI